MKLINLLIIAVIISSCAKTRVIQDKYNALADCNFYMDPNPNSVDEDVFLSTEAVTKEWEVIAMGGEKDLKANNYEKYHYAENNFFGLLSIPENYETIRDNPAYERDRCQKLNSEEINQRVKKALPVAIGEKLIFKKDAIFKINADNSFDTLYFWYRNVANKSLSIQGFEQEGNYKIKPFFYAGDSVNVFVRKVSNNRKNILLYAEKIDEKTIRIYRIKNEIGVKYEAENNQSVEYWNIFETNYSITLKKIN